MSEFEKPPIGARPKYAVRIERTLELLAAIDRHMHTSTFPRFDLIAKWSQEINEISVEMAAEHEGQMKP